MSSEPNIKCLKCGGLIARDAASAGQQVSCPHCGELVTMAVESSAPESRSTAQTQGDVVRDTLDGPEPQNPFSAVFPEGFKVRHGVMMIVVIVAAMVCDLYWGKLATRPIGRMVKNTR